MAANKYKVEARSLESAMEKVKEKFGADALVLDVKEIRKKEPDGLGVGTVFEITVVPESNSIEAVRITKQSDEAPFDNESLARLKLEIQRLERVVQSVNAAGEKIASALGDLSDYPLSRFLITGGASRKSIEVLASSFEEQVPQAERGSLDMASNHLANYIHTVNTGKWEDVSGLHFFFGSGGSGKTGIIIKLAGRLSRLGKDVAVIDLFPRHSGDIKRLEVAGDTLGVGVAAAFSLEDLKNSIRYFGEKEVVLVDTPCILSEKSLLSGSFKNYLDSIELAHRHFVFELNFDDRLRRKELELFETLKCDYAVLSKLDVSMSRAAFIDLIVNFPITFSFLNGSPDYDKGFEIASLPALLRLISPELVVESRKAVKKPLNRTQVRAEEKGGEEGIDVRETVLESVR